MLTALVLAARCANYQDVFVGGNVYFTDADCYARMARARICLQHPGRIIRHHDFENYPEGTTPHTTAPLDYLIVALSILLRPFTAQSLDLAGAVVSPLLAVIGGWFLWWWSRRMRFRYRGTLLILHALSPILVHGAELGRPDHQSLLLVLVTVAVCAEWTQSIEPSRRLSVVSGCAWALAIWVSAYEPLVLFVTVMLAVALQDRQMFFGAGRRTNLIAFALVIAIAALVEQRVPSLSILDSRQLFANWAHSIGELQPVALTSALWFRWIGYLVALAPVLVWFAIRRRPRLTPAFILIVLTATFALTMWQARWGYFFTLFFVLALPPLLEPFEKAPVVWIAFGLSILPVLREWDERLWPNESETARRIEQRNECVQLRGLADTLAGPEVHAFLAPWWLSPAIAYWSGQPGIAGSSHESLNGIADSARFYTSTDARVSREIVSKRKVTWVFTYDAVRIEGNSLALLSAPKPSTPPVCYLLDRTPSLAPNFLRLAGQTAVAKIYRVAELK